jgi:hypothetical protein
MHVVTSHEEDFVFASFIFQVWCFSFCFHPKLEETNLSKPIVFKNGGLEACTPVYAPQAYYAVHVIF